MNKDKLINAMILLFFAIIFEFVRSTAALFTLPISLVLLIISYIVQRKIWDYDLDTVVPKLIISLICTIICGIVAIYRQKLFVSATIIFFVIAVVQIIKLLKNKFFIPRFRFNRENCYVTFITAIVMIPFVVGTLVHADAVRALIITHSPFTFKYSEYRGYEYYSDEKYLTYRWGKDAYRNLPNKNDISNAISVDFSYRDFVPMETYFTNCNTQYFLRVEYSAEDYIEVKASFEQGRDDWTTSWGNFEIFLLEKEHLILGNYLYSLACCNDEFNTVIYLIAVDDSKEYQSFWVLDDSGTPYSAAEIWQEVEG